MFLFLVLHNFFYPRGLTEARIPRNSLKHSSLNPRDPRKEVQE